MIKVRMTTTVREEPEG